MLEAAANYRSFLKQAIARRTEKNPAFSMSALAKVTGISRTFFYDVLSGKKNLSTEAGAKVAARLGLSNVESELFGLLIQLETAKDPAFRQGLVDKIQILK